MRISGFSIVRNAILLEYPFIESVESILPFCDEFIIACGDSEDATPELCDALSRKYPDKVKVVHSVWQKEKQSGGGQLKRQTDEALAYCKHDWCFYIQADEVFLESDFHHLQPLLEKATRDDRVDGILFNYLHFYGSYSYQIEGRNWYRKEVRLFKNYRGIEAFRDAQGFRKKGNPLTVLESPARIFHYGYVRSPESFQKKQREMDNWWGGAPGKVKKEFPRLVNHIGLKRYSEVHPASMAKKIKAPNPFDPKDFSRKWDKREIKNLLTLLWEILFPFRFGEFKNYTVKEKL